MTAPNGAEIVVVNDSLETELVKLQTQLRWR